MEYIKLKNPKKMKKAKKKEYLANLEDGIKRKYRKGQVINCIGQMVGCIVFAVAWFLLDKLIGLIPNLGSGALVVLDGVIFLICNVLNVAIAAIVSIIIYLMILIFVPMEYININVEISRAVSDKLRSFYSFSGKDYIVTKCYESSDKRFNGKDIVLYTVGDEIRIAVNLKHNFFDLKKDLGCYVVSKKEISVIKTIHKGIKAAEIKFSEHSFLVGKRALGFIGK